MTKRVFVVVIDSFGIGSAPDARTFGDEGANTALSISSQFPNIWPNLKNFGLGNVSQNLGYELIGCRAVDKTMASFGALQELSPGKDTTTGHWELAGLPLQHSFPVFPGEYPSFPEKLIKDFIEISRVPGILGNKAASGTQIIAEMGDEHQRTKKPILYTSADSVIQIAAHENIYPLEELYQLCRIMRKLTLDSGLGRVIARPFQGENGQYGRTKYRKDFSLPLPGKTIMDFLQAGGVRTIGVGKIGDIFSGQGFDELYPEKGNPDCLKCTTDIMASKASSDQFIFVNLVDTDMIYGHRRDVKGYGEAVSGIDDFIGKWTSLLRPGDLLMLTADHGCDPGFPGSDHTREYVPLLVYGPDHDPVNLGVKEGFYHLAKTVGKYFLIQNDLPGESIIDF